MLTKKLTVLNPSGLHARPASNFVQTTGRFKSSVNFSKNGIVYNGKSILSVLSACVKCNDEIELHIDGIDESDALDAITSAVKSGLGETLDS